MIKICFIVSIMLLIVISGCGGSRLINPNICGDGQCTLMEDCNTCPQDCVCSNGEYCNEEGICRKDVCGDETCSENEKVNNICCEDCGCLTDNICNKVTQKCQEKIEVSGDIINQTVNEYLTKNGISGNIKTIIDTYYKEQAIKEITIDCGAEGSPYPCEIRLFLNEKGEIIEEIRTT